ncbi:ESYT3 [Symbiodinium sp. CCMP2456]|nr:ESYT3 [Symbiodinium sp. CCMP2456]
MTLLFAPETHYNRNRLSEEQRTGTQGLTKKWSTGGGKSDPYCIVGIPHKKHSTWRTCILFKELNPTWDEEEEMINYEPGDNIKFQVMDYDKKDQDDHLGSALLQSGDFHPDGFEGLPTVWSRSPVSAVAATARRVLFREPFRIAVCMYIYTHGSSYVPFDWPFMHICTSVCAISFMLCVKRPIVLSPNGVY